MFSSSRNSFVGSLFIGLALLGAGCTESVDSENIRTPGISMQAVVTASGGSSRVHVLLQVGGDDSNALIELTANDELIATAGDEEKTMERVKKGEYEATFDTIEGGTEFGVQLLRGDDDIDAKDSGGTLPDPFMITSDLDGEYSRADDDIEITWDPSDSGDDMRLEVSDDDSCITATKDFDPSGDDGVFTIESGDLESNNADEDTCKIRIDVIREREGGRDENLDQESTFFLRQVRSVLADSAP
jgi:hypothetical protein